jgi:MFS family permease
MLDTKERKSYRGYIVVGASFIVALLNWGVYRTYGLFFNPMSSEFGWTSAETSGAFSIAFLIFGIASIIAGRLSDKLGPKLVLIACGVLQGAGYLLMSQIHSIWQLYLLYGLIIGLGMGGIDTPTLSTIVRWFVKQRGMVIGIAKAGAGMGMFLVPLMASWLIPHYGWRDAYSIIGVACVVGIVSVALVFKRNPENLDKVESGGAKPLNDNSGRGVYNYGLREAIRTSQFRIYSLNWFLVSFCTQVAMVHIAPHVIALGISMMTAATILSMIGAVSIIGRLAMGSMSDRMGNKMVYMMSLCFLIASFILVYFAEQPWMFYMFAILYGIAHGAFFTLTSPLLAELFGVTSLGAILGVVIFLGTFGGSTGPYLSGYLFDITGSYHLSFLICLVLSVADFILMLFLKPTNGQRRSVAAG